MATYYIGANDEHGQNPFTQGKRTPVMPYLNVPFYENQFNRPAKIKFMEACLRNGLAVYDVKPEITDTSISERVRRINAQRLTLLVSSATTRSAAVTHSIPQAEYRYSTPLATPTRDCRVCCRKTYTNS